MVVSFLPLASTDLDASHAVTFLCDRYTAHPFALRLLVRMYLENDCLIKWYFNKIMMITSFQFSFGSGSHPVKLLTFL